MSKEYTIKINSKMETFKVNNKEIKKRKYWTYMYLPVADADGKVTDYNDKVKKSIQVYFTEDCLKEFGKDVKRGYVKFNEGFIPNVYRITEDNQTGKKVYPRIIIFKINDYKEIQYEHNQDDFIIDDEPNYDPWADDSNAVEIE